MLSNEKQAAQVFRRVRDFLAQNPPEVGYGSVDKVVDQLKAVIDRLEAHAREQEVRSREALAGTRVKRARSLMIRREYLRPIARAARTLFPGDPSLLATFAMPRARDYEGTIATAEAVAQSAGLRKTQFVAVGFPEDFVERLQKAATDLRAGINTHAQEFGKRSASTAGLRQEYARGRDIVRMLDAMVAPRLAATGDRYAEWQTISRFARQNVPTEGPPAGPVGGSGSPQAAPVTGSEPVMPSSEDEVMAA